MLDNPILFVVAGYRLKEAPCNVLSGRRIWLLAVVLFAGFASAQSPSSGWSAISSMGVVNDIVRVQDIVWAATNGGVLRYDVAKRSYTRFTRVDGLAGNEVLSAVADADGDLWFGTNGDGLSRFVVSANRFSEPFSVFRELELNDLATDGDHLYVANNVGISLFLTDVKRVAENYRQFGSLPRDTAVAAVAIYGGKVWAGTEGGLAWADLAESNLQDPQAWSTDDSVGDVADLLVASDTLFAAAGRNVWRWDAIREMWLSEARLGTVTSLGMYDGRVVALTKDGISHRLSRVNWTEIPISGNVRTLSRDGSALWIGTYGGLAVFGDNPPPPLGDTPANHFYQMTLSADGNLWVASMPNDQTVPPKGIFQFDRTRWWVHDRTTGIPSNLTVAVEMDQLDQLWVGTWGHGLAVLDSQKRWHHLNQSNSILRGITQPDAPTFVVISDIERDRHGNLWLANIQAGLAVMDGFPPLLSHLNTQKTLGLAPGRDIGRLAIGPDDLKWIATPQDGLIMFDDGGTPFEAGDERAVVLDTGFDPRLGSNRVTAVYSNEAGVVWIGTDNGLNRVRYRYDRLTGDFEIASWRDYRLQHGLLSPVITDIEGDTEGNIWAATKGGLTQLKTNGLFVLTYTTANSPLIDDRVESLLFDEVEGELWVGTFGGLGRVQISGPTGSAVSSGSAYPNPLRLSPAVGTRLTISGIPEGSSVSIFSVDGDLVRQLEAFYRNNSVTWDGTNEDGRLVNSGVFFFVATNRLGSSARGKFAVIRER